MAVELVCSDVDGTIVASEYPVTIVSERTIKAVQAIQARGLKFVLVSGRPLRTMIPAADALSLQGVMICLNGALVYDYKNKVPLLSISIERAAACQLVQQAQSIFGDKIAFAVESGSNFMCDEKYYSVRKDYINHAYMLYDNPMKMMDEAPTIEKIIVLHEELLSADLYPILLEHFTDDKWQKKIHMAHGHHRFIDIAAAGVSKGVAMKNLCSELNIPLENVVAFGDMLNDTEMLRFAGRGIAVANAHPLLIKIADETTDSCQDDGVAVVLEKLVGPAQA
ncbi:hypothetical protein INT43_001507 [Umbelopsis isabellina]|uniref:Hydrolase n=1 Tax=Mortierella isabellina TaxID=91625 RepID=A0A8H7PE72_MORIS|nr:hypothetical protein INT43_001507 [Umbelopsis isabellina]